MTAHQTTKQNSSIVITELRGALVLTFPQSQVLSAERRAQIQSQVLERCMKNQAEAVILDLSALNLIDLTEWTWLRNLSRSCKLMGSKIWLVGLKPEVAITLVSMGAITQDLQYALGVEEALNLIHNNIG